MTTRTQNSSSVARAVCVLLIGVVGLVASLGPLMRTPERMRGGIGPFGDTFLYLKLAYNLDAGHGFSGTDDGGAFGLPADGPVTYVPAVARGPVYPMFMCAVYRTIGSHAPRSAEEWPVYWDRVRVAQCLLHALTSVLVFGIVRAIWPTAWWPAFAAGLMQALGAYSLYYTRALLSETVTTFLVTLSILLVVRALATDRLRVWVGAGVALGLTTLARPEYIAATPLLAAYAWWVTRSRGGITARHAVAMMVAAVCVVAPWTLRNLSVTGRPIPVATGGAGLNLYVGSYETSANWKGWGAVPPDIFFLPRERERLVAAADEYLRAIRGGGPDVIPPDTELRRLALERIQARPMAALSVWIGKIPRLWYQDYIPMYQDPEASGVWFLLYFALALAAFWLAPPGRRVFMGVVAMLFLYLNVLFLPVHVEPRYGVALMPGIIAIAGIGLGAVVRRLAGRSAG